MPTRIRTRTRIREVIGTAVTALGAVALTAVAPASVPEAAAAPPPPPRNELTIDPTAHVAPDGTITMTGTYRCLLLPGGSTAPVLVASNLMQGGRSSGIGGSRAVCDGDRHTWRNSARPYRAPFRPGPARADGTLMQFKKTKSGILLPHFVAVAGLRDVTLVTRP
ncbi:DUF6299 family protein [Streptomyces sp. NPDC021096]|uniref:DUF6299 family protein n=1 Tax=Streptomyces sp. NPDC021096 TaxID=3154792 RepID=UPI0034071251